MQVVHGQERRDNPEHPDHQEHQEPLVCNKIGPINFKNK